MPLFHGTIRRWLRGTGADAEPARQGQQSKNDDQVLGRFDLELRSGSRFALICAIECPAIASLCLIAGQTAQEFEPEGKAAQEVAELFNWVSGLLGLSARKQEAA